MSSFCLNLFYNLNLFQTSEMWGLDPLRLQGVNLFVVWLVGLFYIYSSLKGLGA